MPAHAGHRYLHADLAAVLSHHVDFKAFAFDSAHLPQQLVHREIAGAIPFRQIQIGDRYDVLGITPPRVVDGFQQDPIDGVSMKYSFADPKADGQKRVQYFEVMGSRGVYYNGWMGSVFGPRIPWVASVGGLAAWNPDADVWSVYNLDEDYSQSTDLAAKSPAKVAEAKDWFSIEAALNKVYPVGGGL